MIFVTGNENKLCEAQAIIGEDITNQKIDLEEIQDTPENIVAKKAKQAYKITGKPCFVDDTSLECTALGGLPGPYVKFFIKKIGADGIYKMLESFEDKSTKVVCVIGYCDGEKTQTFRAEVEGKLTEPRGKNGFGFDSIFVPKGHDKTYAEMEPDEKNQVSHRKKVLHKFKEFITR